jgi:hypothetical protein
MERATEIIGEPRSADSEPEWPELVSRAINDLSRIVHAEIRLVELGIKRVVEKEIERWLKVALALGFLLCAAVCGVSAAVIGFHALVGLWWAAFAIVALLSTLVGTGLFLWARQRPEPEAVETASGG